MCMLSGVRSIGPISKTLFIFRFHFSAGGDNARHVYDFYKIKNIYQETMEQKLS